MYVLTTSLDRIDNRNNNRKMHTNPTIIEITIESNNTFTYLCCCLNYHRYCKQHLLHIQDEMRRVTLQSHTVGSSVYTTTISSRDNRNLIWNTSRSIEADTPYLLNNGRIEKPNIPTLLLSKGFHASVFEPSLSLTFDRSQLYHHNHSSSLHSRGISRSTHHSPIPLTQFPIQQPSYQKWTPFVTTLALSSAGAWHSESSSQNTPIPLRSFRLWYHHIHHHHKHKPFPFQQVQIPNLWRLFLCLTCLGSTASIISLVRSLLCWMLAGVGGIDAWSFECPKELRGRRAPGKHTDRLEWDHSAEEKEAYDTLCGQHQKISAKALKIQKQKVIISRQTVSLRNSTPRFPGLRQQPRARKLTLTNWKLNSRQWRRHRCWILGSQPNAVGPLARNNLLWRISQLESALYSSREANAHRQSMLH